MASNRWLKIGVIPDTQCREGVSTKHLIAAGNYFAEKAPDVIIHLGDHWDFPSLNFHSKKIEAEGTRVKKDIDFGNESLRLLTEAIHSRKDYHPRLVLLRGNHEERLTRAIADDPKLLGLVGYHLFDDKKLGWEVHDFLKVVTIGGIMFSHYFYNPNTGKPWGGDARYKLSKIHQSFTMGHVQGLSHSMLEIPNGGRIRGLVAGSFYCLAPHHQVLMADLTYRSLGDLNVGDQLVSVDEHSGVLVGRSRRFKTGTVERIEWSRAQLHKVTLSNGKQFLTTDDHLWLVKGCGNRKWMATKDLRKGEQATHVNQILREWKPIKSYDVGWLAGLYDGEGHLYTRKTTGGYTAQLGLSQKKGAVLDRALNILRTDIGVHAVSDCVHNDVHTIRIVGGQSEIVRVLGTVRPQRLLTKWHPEMLGTLNAKPGNEYRIISVEPAGEQDFVKVQVDARTMVVEGFIHHNCHEEGYKGPQANHHWRGILMKHEVRKGYYDLMEVSIEYLLRKYS